jgi:hypothetical protein
MLEQLLTWDGDSAHSTEAREIIENLRVHTGIVMDYFFHKSLNKKEKLEFYGPPDAIATYKESHNKVKEALKATKVRKVKWSS